MGSVNNTYKVDKDGKAPAGLKPGDLVVTGGGTYKITGGSYGNYTSEKVDANQNTYNYKGSYATPSSTPKPFSGSSGKPATTTPNNVTTNTSYNGSYLTVDLNQDYTKLANDAAGIGDYTSAARYEAMRNAKVNYLNSIGNNPNNYEITNNYVKDYGYTNNQGGQIFTDSADNIGALNDNWTAATVNGIKYTKDAQGNIYAGNTLVGDGFNAATGEMTFQNTEAAKKAAYDRYLSTVHNPNLSGLNREESYNYLDQKGIVDTGYINAIQQGTVGEYLAELERQAQAKIDEENLRKLLAAQEQTKEEVVVKKPIPPVGEVTDTEQAVLDDNSFETDAFAPSYQDKQIEYQRKRAKQGYIMSRLY